MLKIRRSWDRLIFNMGIPIPAKTVFILRQGPGIYRPHYLLFGESQLPRHLHPFRHRQIFVLLEFLFQTSHLLTGKGRSRALFDVIWDCDVTCRRTSGLCNSGRIISDICTSLLQNTYSTIFSACNKKNKAPTSNISISIPWDRHMGLLGFVLLGWQWAETLVEIRGPLADIKGTTK